jgi:hypothetical protein
MVFYKSSYPLVARVYLKVVPSFVLCVAILTAPPILTNLKDYIVDGRNKKLIFKSNFLERTLRDRIPRNKNFVMEKLYEQPY